MGQHPSITSIRRLIGFELALSAQERSSVRKGYFHTSDRSEE